MKRISALLTLTTCLLFVFYACKKDLSQTGNLPASDKAISLSASNIRLNQPLQASLITAENANWTVSPSDGAEVDAQGNEATFLFALPGSYTITATGSDGNISKAFIAVKNQRYYGADSLGYGDSTYYDSSYLLPLSGDQIALKPIVANDTMLVLYSITQNKYPCRNNSLLNNVYVYGNGDSSHSQYDTLSTKISFNGVYEPAPSNCVSGSVRAKSFIYLPNYPLGVSPFSVVLNGKTYYGSITTTKTYYQFNWAYTSGVIISPKKIARK